MTRHALTIAELEQWAASGAHWRVVDISAGHAVVDMCACTGEPMERVESDDPAVISYLRTAADRSRTDLHLNDRRRYVIDLVAHPREKSSHTMNTETVKACETERMNIGREAPELSRALVALEREIRIDSVLRELVKLRASILNGCAYCIDMHTKDARKAGESEQRLYAVAAWHEAPFFSERERAALALTDAVTLLADTHVPADTWKEAARHFDSEELAHLLWQIAAINAWNRIAVATRQTVGNYQP